VARGGAGALSRRCPDRRGGRQGRDCSPCSVCEPAFEKSSAGSVDLV
jgi:hypothetical protein